MDKQPWKLFLFKPLFSDQKEFVIELYFLWDGKCELYEMCYFNVICYVLMFSNFSECNMIL